MRGDIYWFQNRSCRCALLCSLPVSVACRSSFHKNWHQTQYKLNVTVLYEVIQIQGQMWKNVNTWKIGLWCYHKYVKFISRFYFYSWKMASCRFVVWNWNLEVCFSSAVTLTTPPSSQVPPNLLLDFYRILEEKKKMEGGGKTLAF